MARLKGKDCSVFVRITNRDIWNKLLEHDTKLADIHSSLQGIKARECRLEDKIKTNWLAVVAVGSVAMATLGWLVLHLLSGG